MLRLQGPKTLLYKVFAILMLRVRLLLLLWAFLGEGFGFFWGGGVRFGLSLWGSMSLRVGFRVMT